MSSSNPSLLVDTSELDPVDDSVLPNPEAGSSARLVTSATRGRSVSFSQSVLPALKIPGSSSSDRPTATPRVAGGGRDIHKARNESRKLLSHLLDQLQQRPLPSSLGNPYSQMGGGSAKLGAVVRSVKNAVLVKEPTDRRSSSLSVDGDGDNGDEVTEADFYTDLTFDLMSQLKDIFVVASTQQWDLFTEPGEKRGSRHNHGSTMRPSSFLLRRSMQAGRQDSSPRPVSPSRTELTRTPGLLSQCISVLSSVVMTDCQYQVSSPSPLRPPNALQAVVLDVAQFLVHSHQDNPEVLSRISFAMIYAFHTFKPSMHARLLVFFDESVLGNIFGGPERVRQQVNPTPIIDAGPEDASSHSPMVSILVDEAKEETISPQPRGGWNRWSEPRPLSCSVVRSDNAPYQDLDIYYLASLVPPLLAAVTENVDFLSTNLPTIHRLHIFFSRLAKRRPTLYLDLLNIVAYHTPRSRHHAISLLLSYWPRAIGHLVIAKPFVQVNYADAVARAADRGVTLSRQSPLYDHEHPYAHQFMPWRFRPNSKPLLYEGISRDECRVCSKVIQGFGLVCSLCMCSVHFDCYDYPEGSFLAQYAVALEPNIQKVAVHRFSQTLPSNHHARTHAVRKEQHLFRPVNIFGLALCFICCQPLWGCIMQGLRCNLCKHFVHSSCLTRAPARSLGRCRTVPIDSTHVFIDWSTLRRSFIEHYSGFLLSESDIRRKTYEELAIVEGVLWTQLRILENGMALGSIVVTDGTTTPKPFELHHHVLLCNAILASGGQIVSSVLSDYLLENHLQADEYLLFNWSALTYMVSVVKTSMADPKVSHHLSSDLLNVIPLDYAEPTGDSCPMEAASLGHIRDRLGDCFGISSDSAAQYLLNYVHHLGLLQVTDYEGELFRAASGADYKRMQCFFPLPFGFDASADIETLVAAVEACLSDLDLSTNETGFLLLTRRFWPDGMLSGYTFDRLARAVLSWIFCEDDDLATILRDFVARGRTLPGVRAGVENQAWPNQHHARLGVATSNSNGGDYVASRRALSQRYVVPWLLALHDQEVSEYANLVYDIITEHAEGDRSNDPLLCGIPDQERKKHTALMSDRVLRLILKAGQASVVFTALDDLFRKWLQTVYDLDRHEPSNSLPRLFNKDAEVNQRYSTMIDPRMTIQDYSALTTINPLQHLIHTAKESKDGFLRALHWLCLFASSGVDIPTSSFIQFGSLVIRFKTNLAASLALMKATLCSCWLKAIGRQELQGVVASLHAHLSAEILQALRDKEKLRDAITFIRQSLAVCLLLFGCDRNALLSLEMVREDEVEFLPSRRKIQARASAVMDPIIVDSNLMVSIRSYVGATVGEVSCLVAKFLNAFVNESPLVESYEVDNFILRNGVTLCTCAWQFYGTELLTIGPIRASLLLRVLAVDSQPFQLLITELLDNAKWETRLHTVDRLFRIICDVTSSAFRIEGQQWRPSVIDIFYYFFSSLWLDRNEEIRMAVETWSQNLLPVHFEVIALCWGEALNKIPVTERVKLVSFLAQLRSHFPQWRVLGWDPILDSLLETEFVRKNGERDDGLLSAHLSLYGLLDRRNSSIHFDSELVALQVSLVCLSLQMIADGMTIDHVSLLKVKSHAATLFGFQDVALAPGSGHSFHVKFTGLGNIPTHSYPAFRDLFLTLDSPSPLLLAPSAMDSPYADDDLPARLLVGSLFADLFLEIVVRYEELASLPSMVLKNLFKSVIALIHKHDFESKPLRHLQANLRRAVRRTLDFLLDPTSFNYEIKQLCLGICQAFIKVWPGIAGSFLCEAIESAARLMVLLRFEQNIDDPLVGQTKLFLETNLLLFSSSGVILALFKRYLDSDFFNVLQYITEAPSGASSHVRLRDALLKDALSRVADSDAESLQMVAENISQYVSKVHHSHYSPELLQLVGHAIIAVARKAADWVSTTFDTSPLLLLTASLLEHNKAQSRDFMPHIENLLRVSLVRSFLSAYSLARILRVTATLYRKSGTPEQCLALNHIALFIFEQLVDKLYDKAHVILPTLVSLLEVFTPQVGDDLPLQLPQERVGTLVDAAIAYLCVAGAGIPSRMEHNALRAAATMVVRTVEQQQILSKMAELDMPVRSWNMILLAVLTSDSTTTAAALFDSFHSFSLAYHRSLGTYQQSNLDGAQDVVQIGRAYTSIKLWLLLIRKATAIRSINIMPHDGSRVNPLERETDLTRMVWNELWPFFENVVCTLESDPVAASFPALISTMSSSVADLFLFTHQARFIVALEVSSQIALLNRLKALSGSDTKVNRVLQQILESPPDAPLDFFVQQTMTEIWAEEKLEVAKREEMIKNPPEKGRSRIVT